MSGTATIPIRGFVADDLTGAGVGGLRVELWPADGAAVVPVAAGRSNDAGAFRIELPAERLRDHTRTGVIDLEVRVVDRGRLVSRALRAVSLAGRTGRHETIDVIVPNDGRGWKSERLDWLGPQPGSSAENDADDELNASDDAGEADEIAEASRLDAGAAASIEAEVRGRVSGPIPDGARVEAVLKTLSDRRLEEQVVAQAVVNGAGWYRMRYALPAGARRDAVDVSLTVRLRAGDGALAGEAGPVLAPPARARLDVHASASGSDGRASEYERLERHIDEHLTNGSAGLDGAASEVIEEVSEWLAVESDRVTTLQTARALELHTGVPAPLYYALGRGGLGLAVEDLVDVPTAELRTAIEEAAAGGIIGPAALVDLDASLDKLTGVVVDHALDHERPSMRAGLGDILAAANIPRERIKPVLERYHARTGTAVEFWESLFAGDGAIEEEAVDEQTAAAMDSAVRLAGLIGPDPALLRKVHQLRADGRWKTLEDLTELGVDEWATLLEGADDAETRDVAPVQMNGHTNGAGAHAHVSEDEGESVSGVVLECGGEAEDDDEQEDEHAETDEAAERIAVRAQQIVEALEDTFPSAYIRRALAHGDDIGASARLLLSRAHDHDLVAHSIHDRVRTEPSLLEGLEGEEAERAVEDVAAVERLARVTERAEEVAILVGTGVRSAMDIGCMPKRQFIEVYGEALGGRPQAARVHAQAQLRAGASKLAAIRVWQARQHVPLVLGGAPDPALKDLPDARALFGSGSLCGCEHCGSVYSPAAYFVDLLRYLNYTRDQLDKLQKKLDQKRQAGAAGAAAIERAIEKLRQFQPLDVLLARRSDLADLPLTCENTLTPLPYIDLVNEVLEAYITGGSAAFDTGKTPADVLRAVPANVSRAAYAKLEEAVYPASLPYHQPLALARAYLGHLGITRLELLRVLGGAQPEARPAALAEALAMSPAELRHVTATPEDLWRHYGFDAATDDSGVRFSAALAEAPAFLEATGITFQHLIDLVSTRFVNADNTVALSSAAPDCDPAGVRIVGLDDARLARMLRLLRVERRLGWKLADLDRALAAFGATELDLPTLEKLADARELARRLDRPIAELLVLWAPLDTWGPDNQFDRLLATRAVAWRLQDARTLQLRPDRAELVEPGESLDPVASALLAAFRITSDDLALLRAIQARRGAPPRLDLAGLSGIYRVLVLARALGLRIRQLDFLLRLAPLDADPFRAGEPAGALRFVDLAREVDASDFTPERLAYLFRHEAEPKRDPGPLPAQVEAVVAGLRRALADAYTETRLPTEVAADTLRGKLALLLDPSLLDPVVEALDPRTAAPAARRRELFQRHLARLFPDPAAAAERLFGPTPVTAPVTTTPASIPAATPAPKSAVAADPDASARLTAGAPAAPPEGADEADAAPAPKAPADNPLEQRWRSSTLFVLEHVLPHLRARQLRGAVVQGLADALGISAAATARLLDGVLRSRRRPGQPVIGDFLALLGTGLTGAYFPNRTLRGAPVVTRLDAELALSRASAPVDGLPARGWSARWSGNFLPRSSAKYIFYVRSEGAVRLTLKIGGTERVLVDAAAVDGAAAVPVEHASEPVALDPKALHELRLEYRNNGGPATLAVQVGTGPGVKQPLDPTDLYPADGLTSFAPVEEAYRRLHKAAAIITGLGVTDLELEWMTAEPPFLRLDDLPTQAPTAGASADAEAIALFARWRQLAALHALRRKLPRSNTDLFEVLRAETFVQALDRLVLATGWERPVIEALLGPQGLAIDTPAALRPSPDGSEPALVRLARAIDLQRRAGVSPETLFAWARGTPDADTAAAVVQAVKARYDEKRWLEVARALNDPLRAERRDALVSFLLPRMRGQGVRNRNQLFEYFLIDVDMMPCMLTSRIRQAIGSVQTFFQRSLMNLEPKVSPRLIDDSDWKWMKNYRVWEANRKVFLYPENWIEPELRDDKTPLFQELERSILQQEIKKENVEAAFADYLEGLDEISRLDVRGVWFERRDRRLRRITAPSGPPDLPWDEGTYHVFARTFNAPHVWYYRRLERGRSWSAWEKIEADIEGDHLVPVVFQRRMHLFWTVFREVNKPTPPMNKEDKGPPPKLGKDWEIHLAYSVHDRGKWSRKRLSSAGILDRQRFVFHRDGEVQEDGSSAAAPSDYTLRATVLRDDVPHALPRLTISLYARHVASFGARAPTAVEHTFAPADVAIVGRFQLEGCSGSLDPERPVGHERVKLQKGLHRFSHGGQGLLTYLIRRGTAHPFRVGDGGVLPAPSGYRVDGVRYRANGGGTLLGVRPADGRGTGLVLSANRGAFPAASVLPVVDPARPEDVGMYPFFYQDETRSYFARPVVGNYHAPRFLPMPLFGRRFWAAAPKRTPVAPHRRGHGGRPARGGRGRREDIEAFDEIQSADEANDLVLLDEAEMAPEALDAWHDALDDAFHPDDAAEARRRPRPRARQTAPRIAPPARRGAVVVRPPAPRPAPPRSVFTAGFHELRLRFVPFEHPSTCHLISRLKTGGIELLLDYGTTRPAVGADHVLLPSGQWMRAPRTQFAARYQPGPLVDQQNLPTLDIDFHDENPYAAYNWELFFHAPLQVAIRLAKDGRHEEAQRWFHFIFDPTTDASSPPPRRYWRFAPFHENDEYAGARDIMGLLAYTGAGDTPAHRDAQLARQRRAIDQLAAWWEKPFSPHVIARLRIVAYQKAVVMKYIDNLIEWGDKLFRQDTMESIQEATQLYILAGNIMGPRPEQIPPLVERKPLTFQQMRQGLDLFSNFEVRIENGQVRRPFRLDARPDASGAASVLGMATQYFCTPANPQLDKYWDTVADRLFKIRNCMNIQGIVRQLPLFEPPIDPGMLVRAAAAGVDLGSVIANLNAPPPHHRFKPLLGRALRLADELRSFGAATLSVLERKDAEGLATLRASNETALVDAVRDIRKKQTRQVEEELAQLSLVNEHLEIQAQHLNTQLAQLMNPQEQAAQQSLTAGQVISGIAEGADLVSKVLHAIPDFQTGAAGGFSSPFVTLQLGGQMFGEIASAFAESLQKVMSRNETEADLAAAQAEYQRRRDEWQHELELINKEKAKVGKQIAETQLKLEISNAELRRHELEVENARKVESYLRDKYTNAQLYGWMLGQLSGAYFQAYKVAFDSARQAERAYRFERGEPSAAFVEFSYWDSLKKGLFAGERLLLDLRRMEAAHVEGDARGLELTRHLSLRDDHPLALAELLATGKCQLEVTEALLDGDFPGHYFRRLKTVSLSAVGPIAAHANVNCTLTLLENRIRTDANASGTYAQAEEGDDARFLVNFAPVQAVATSRPSDDAGVFQLRFDDERFLPFEGAGAIASFRLELQQADNAVDLSQLGDVVLTLAYTARNGGAALEAAARASREKGVARGAIKPAPQHQISVRRDLPELWKRLAAAKPGQEVEGALPLEAERLSGRYRGLDVRVERVTLFAHARRAIDAEALRVHVDPPKGAGGPASGWAAPWPGARTMRATAEIAGKPGPWKIGVTTTGGTLPELADDLVLIFELRARKT